MTTKYTTEHGEVIEVLHDLRDIKSGDIGLVSGKSFLSKTIQEFQELENKKGSHWNHAMVYQWIDGYLFVFEADKWGIRSTPFKDYLFSNRDLLVLSHKTKRMEGTAQLRFMLPSCGATRYDKWNLVVAQAVKMLTFGRLWLGGSKPKDNRFICGEWAAYVWNNFYPGTFQENTAKVSPVEIWENTHFKHLYIDRELLIEQLTTGM